MNAERVGSLFWLTVGAGTIYGATALGLGTPREPGSGFLAFVAGVFVCVMAAGILLASYRAQAARAGRLGSLWSGCDWRRSLTIAALTLAFILAFEWLGFFATSFVLLVIMMRVLEKLSWPVSVGVPLATLAASYLLFKLFLGTSLPPGVFGI